MRYINKNQIIGAIINEWLNDNDELEGYSLDIVSYGHNTHIVKNTKKECIALAENLGLTLID